LRLKKKSKAPKEQRNVQFQNNMYEVTRYEGSFESKEAEEYKKTIKKGQATLNKRENPTTQQEIKPIQKISKKDKALKEAAKNIKNNPKQKNNSNQNQNKNKNQKDNKQTQNDKNQPKEQQNQNKNKNKNQPQNKPKEPIKTDKVKVEKPNEEKKKPQQNPKPKRPYAHKDVNLKGLTDLVSKHKKAKPQWYENEQIQYAGIGVLCFIVISVIYSYIFTAPTSVQ